MTDMNSVREIECCDKFINVRGISIYVIAVNCLGRAPMPAAVVRDHSVASFQKESPTLIQVKRIEFKPSWS